MPDPNLYKLDEGGTAVTVAHPLPVALSGAANPATIYTAQLTAGTSASQFGSRALVNGAVVTNDPDGTAIAYVGPAGVTAATGYKLKPGQSISFGVTNASAIYVLTTSGTTPIYLAGN